MQYLVEPHCHSAETSRCSRLDGAQLVREIQKSGYQAMIVTDHYDPEAFFGYEKGLAFKQRLHDYFYEGYRRALEEGQKRGMLVLPGLELRIKEGLEDYLIYGVEPEELADMGCLTNLSIGQVRGLVEECGGLFIQAHPFRGYLRCMEAKDLHGVEVLNANPRHDSHNDQALRFARENGLLMTAGSDVHQLGDAGTAGMLFEGEFSVKGFCRAVKEGTAKCVRNVGGSFVEVQ